MSHNLPQETSISNKNCSLWANWPQMRAKQRILQRPQPQIAGRIVADATFRVFWPGKPGNGTGHVV
jgi:hypothetical protein